MPLQFIIGGAGSGKSTYVLNELLHKSAADKSQQYFLVVPEQYTLQTQRKLVTMQKNHSVFQIDIVSFGRLAYRIFEELCIDSPDIIDETGKCLILRKVLEQEKDNLKIYRSKVGTAGFVEKMKSMISECYQYRVDERALQGMISATDGKPLLQGKLRDTEVILHAFKDYLAENYITQEEVLELFLRKIEESVLLKNSEIVFDGFIGQTFTPIQYEIIGKLLKVCKKVTITLSISKEAFLEKNQMEGIFTAGFAAYTKIKRMAEESGITVLPERCLDYRREKPEQGVLSHLERNIFRYGNIGRETIYNNEISLFGCKNPKEEALFIAGKIRELVENGSRYREIAVVTADMNLYKRYLTAAFEDYEIPYFADDKSSLVEHPFVDALRSFLEILASNFTYESIMRFLRCGLHPFTMEEVDAFSVYIREIGRRGYGPWHTPFQYTVRGMNDEGLQQMEAMRKQLVFWTDSFVWGKKKMSVGTWVDELCVLIEKLQMEQHIEALLNIWEKEWKLAKAMAYKQIFPKVLELLKKIKSLLENEAVDAREFLDILTAGLEDIKIAIIPPTLDQVAILDMDRSRSGEVKTLFFVGMNDGSVPRIADGSGILSDGDREYLKNMRFEMAPTARESAGMQLFTLYTWLTKPQEQLILSHSYTDMQGGAAKPSYVIKMLQGIFTNIEIVSVSERKLYSQKEFKRRLAAKLRDFDDENAQTKEMYQMFLAISKMRPEESDFLPLLVGGATFMGGKEQITKEAAKELFGAKMYGGVTALEQYAACGYQFFLTHGLELKEPREYKTSHTDIGTLFHDALDLFSKELREKHLKWGEIPQDVQAEMVNAAVHEAALRSKSLALFGNARNEYLLKRVERITNRSVWVLGEHIKMSKFEPRYYEFAVGNGRVDRIDLYEEDGRIFVKVIDYKSGNKQFKFMDTYYGLQMQLVLYMEQVLQMEKIKHRNCEVIPAGVFYYNLKDPMLEAENVSFEAESDEQEYRQKRLLREFKMSGLVNSMPRVVEALDETLKDGQGTSDIIPVAYGKTGLKKTSSTLTTEQFEAFLNFAKQKATDLRGEVAGGNIAVNPYENGQKHPCDYCPFHGVCGFDKKLPGYQYRNLNKLTKEQVLEKIQASAEHSGKEQDDGSNMDAGPAKSH